MITNRNNTLKLRAHSVRNLTAAELRAARGGCGDPCPDPWGPQRAHGPNIDVKHK